MFTTSKIATGYFSTQWNGQDTKYQIINLDLGISGNGRNMYGIENKETKKITKVGSLAKAKKQVAHWLKVENKDNQEETLNIDAWEPVSEAEQEEKIQQELQNIRLRKHSK